MGGMVVSNLAAGDYVVHLSTTMMGNPLGLTTVTIGISLNGAPVAFTERSVKALSGDMTALSTQAHILTVEEGDSIEGYWRRSTASAQSSPVLQNRSLIVLKMGDPPED